MLLKPCWKRQGFSPRAFDSPKNELPVPKDNSLGCLLQGHQCPCSLPRKTEKIEAQSLENPSAIPLE